ncbi:rac GTPase-activating protein 1 [Polymixia lowei]
MENVVLNLHSVFDNLSSQIDFLNESVEPQFIQMALNFDDCRRKWLRLEQDLGCCKEVLAKTETERGALEVKLKHARNQVDVEIRRRQKAEADCEKLDRQIQLIRELLISEGSTNSIQLNEEQRSALAFLNARSQAPPNLNTSRRLTRIDESASILSDISYDKTDDSLDWDSSVVNTVRLKKREKRRSSRNHIDGPPTASKRSRSTTRKSERGNESLVAKTTVTVPADGGPVEAVSTIESIPVPYWTRSRKKSVAMEWDSESVQSEDVFKQPHKHERDIRAAPSTPHGNFSCLPSFYTEIAGTTGLYRLSGADRTVKELKEKFLRGKTVPLLSKVEDIHAITGLLKDFLRNLKEPLLTFRLNQAFMEAAEIADDDNSIAQIYQTISDLPQANRDTLAFLVIHLQRVAQSVNTKMDISNLARVFGPTIVGHSVLNPEPMMILQDTKRQPKVVERLLALPLDYWNQFMMVENEQPNSDHMIIQNANCYSTPDMKMSMLGPLTTPEHQLNKTPSSSSLSQRMKSTLTPRFINKSKSTVGLSRQGNFFASPLLK